MQILEEKKKLQHRHPILMETSVSLSGGTIGEGACDATAMNCEIIILRDMLAALPHKN